MTNQPTHTHTDLSDAATKELIDAWSLIAGRDGITNPDRLPYTKILEDITQEFTQKTGIKLELGEVYWKLMNLRKAGKL